MSNATPGFNSCQRCKDDDTQIPVCHHDFSDGCDPSGTRKFSIEGRVRSMSGPNTPRDTLDPEFAFDLRLNPGATRGFYIPLSTSGSEAMIATISAAYIKGASLLVWEVDGDPNRAARVQIRATI